MPRMLCIPLTLVLLVGCGAETPPSAPTPQPQGAAAPPAPPAPYAGMTAFVGAKIWDGTGARAMDDAVLLVKDGRIQEILSGIAADGADVVDLDGSWIVPGLINAHAHVSGRWADDEV